MYSAVNNVETNDADWRLDNSADIYERTKSLRIFGLHRTGLRTPLCVHMRAARPIVRARMHTRAWRTCAPRRARARTGGAQSRRRRRRRRRPRGPGPCRRPSACSRLQRATVAPPPQRCNARSLAAACRRLRVLYALCVRVSACVCVCARACACVRVRVRVRARARVCVLGRGRGGGAPVHVQCPIDSAAASAAQPQRGQ